MIWRLCVLLAALYASAPHRQSPVVYDVTSASRLEVKTGKAGLLGFVGHEHVIAARAFSGRITYRADSIEASRVEITVPAESLEVQTPPDTAERRKVRETMDSEVLDVAHHPEIRLVSRSVRSSTRGVHLVAALTIKDSTRDVPIDVQLSVAGDTLRASTSFAIRQTDWGIRPYRGGPGGTVRVADKVTFDIHVVAVRR